MVLFKKKFLGFKYEVKTALKCQILNDSNLKVSSQEIEIR